MNNLESSLLIVIVIYNESIYNTKTYKSLIKEKNINLFIYDNSPTPQHIESEFPTTWIYISNPTNPGLSYAYNCAAKYAKEQKIKWILLTDQDTIFDSNILNEYEISISKYPNIKLFVPIISIGNKYFISPLKMKHHTTKYSKHVPYGINKLTKYSPINSGMMILVEAFLESGGYNEKVRIDYSDYQFIEQFSKKHEYFFVLKSICYQGFSNIVHSPQQKLLRYISFCDSLKNCNKSKNIDRIEYFIIAFKRMISLIIRTRNLTPIKIFFKYYL